jgi:hypothetical protein
LTGGGASLPGLLLRSLEPPGEEARSLFYQPLPSLSADAVHLCPARSPPPHPKHLPGQPYQQVLSFESPGQQLQGEKQSRSSAPGLGEEEELKTPSHSPAAGNPQDTRAVPGGWANVCHNPGTLPRCSTAHKNSGQASPMPLLCSGPH